MLNNFSRKFCRLWDNVEKYGTAGQATGNNIIRRMHLVCWITKVTGIHSEYVILLLFHCKNRYASAPQCYVIPTFPVLLLSVFHVCVCVCVCVWVNNEQGHHQLYVNNRRVFAPMYGEALVCTHDVTSVNYNVWVPGRIVMWKVMIWPRPYL
jgi:hypothetical protein